RHEEGSAPQQVACLLRKRRRGRVLKAEQGHNVAQSRGEWRTISFARCYARRLETSEARVVRKPSRRRPAPDEVTGIGQLRQGGATAVPFRSGPRSLSTRMRQSGLEFSEQAPPPRARCAWED